MPETYENIFEHDGRVRPTFGRSYTHPSDRHPRLTSGWWVAPFALAGAVMWACVIVAWWL